MTGDSGGLTASMLSYTEGGVDWGAGCVGTFGPWLIGKWELFLILKPFPNRKPT
jgi:hypothetical protein